MTEELRNLEAALGVMRDGLGIGEFEVERFLPESDQLFDLLVRIRLKFENIYSQAKVVREFHQLLTGFVDPDKNKFRCGVFRVSQNLHEIRKAGLGGIIEPVKIVDDHCPHIAKVWKLQDVLQVGLFACAQGQDLAGNSKIAQHLCDGGGLTDA